MMKKTLIASAIAAATFSGTASAQASLSAAELSAKIDSMPTVYGNIQYAVTHTDVEDGSSEVSHFDNGSTIGLKHDHEIAPGITGFLKLELEGIDADNKDNEDDNAGLNELDEAYIGIKGERFGQVWVGSDDSQYETLIDAIEEYYEVASLNIGADFETGEGDLLQYISPSFNGLTLHGAVAIQGDGDEQYDKKSYPYQLGVKYSTDMFMVALAMDSNDGSGNAENTYGLHAAVTPVEGATLGLLYSTRSGDGIDENAGDPGDLELGNEDGQDLFGAYARYVLGANTFQVSYEQAEADENDLEASTVTLQALHNVSDNLYVYTEGYLRNNDDGNTDKDTTQLALGAVYYF